MWPQKNKRQFKPILLYGGLAAFALAAAAFFGLSSPGGGGGDGGGEPTPDAGTTEIVVAEPEEAESEVAVEVEEEVPPAYVRLVHLSPNAGSLDFYLNGEKLASGYTYQQYGDTLMIDTSGMVTLAARLAGTSPDSAPLIEGQVNLAPWMTHILAVANNLENIQIGAYIVPTANIPEGYGRIQVLHAAPGSPRMHVKTGENIIIARDLGYLEDPVFVDLPAGEHRLLAATAESTATLVLDQPTYIVKDGVVTTIFIVNGSPPKAMFMTTWTR
jgi:hypothetical protein